MLELNFPDKPFNIWTMSPPESARWSQLRKSPCLYQKLNNFSLSEESGNLCWILEGHCYILPYRRYPEYRGEDRHTPIQATFYRIVRHIILGAESEISSSRVLFSLFKWVPSEIYNYFGIYVISILKSSLYIIYNSIY